MRMLHSQFSQLKIPDSGFQINQEGIDQMWYVDHGRLPQQIAIHSSGHLKVVLYKYMCDANADASGNDICFSLSFLCPAYGIRRVIMSAVKS
jgi:hypothetical protein